MNKLYLSDAINILPEYKGRVKCVYIDPPYNTGRTDLKYNDRRADWAGMMRPRLEMLRDTLTEDGAIFVSIDDNEVHTLRFMLDDIFGSRNYLATFVWVRDASSRNNTKYISRSHEYIVSYALKKSAWRANRLPRTESANSWYKNPDNDPRGDWSADNYTDRRSASNPMRGWYPIRHPKGHDVWPNPRRAWRYNQERHEANVADNRVWWGIDGTGTIPAYKRFLSEVSGMVPRTILPCDDFGSSTSAKKDIIKMFPDWTDQFSTPKPLELIKHILHISTNPGDIVLDCFAGSGTTGHACIEMDRQFILIEIDPETTENITRKRLEIAGGKFECIKC